MNSLKKRLLVGLSAGLVAGTVIIGIGGRIAMRGIAILAGVPGGYSWGGTLDVVAFGLITGIISGVVFGLVEKYAFTNHILTGLLFGVLVFVCLLLLPIDAKGAARGFPELQGEIHLIFGGLLLIYGMALTFIYKWCLKI